MAADPRSELEELRRIDELERRASGEVPAEAPVKRTLSAASRASANERYDPTGNFLQNLGEGAGRGFVNVGSKVANLALPKSLEPKWATDEAIKDREQLDAPLMDTWGGTLGNFGTEMIATAPIGGGLASGAKAVGSGISKVAPRLAAAVASSKAAGVAGRVALAGAQGGSEGLVLASPDDREGGAGMGAALGASLRGAIQLGGRLVKSLSKSRISPEAAEALREMKVVDPDAFIPASHALEPGALKSIYQGIIANIPGVGQRVRGQLDTAKDVGMRRVVDEITPHNTPLEQVFPRGSKLTQAMEALNSKGDSGGKWDEALGKYKSEIFDTDTLTIPPFAQQALSSADDPFINPGMMSGRQLTLLSTKLQEIGDEMIEKKAGGSDVRGVKIREQVERARSEIDEIIKRKVTPQGGQPPPEFDNWMADRARFKEYSTFKSAAAQTPDASPSFKALAQKAVQRDADAGVMGQAGPMQELGNKFGDVLEDFPSKQGIFQQTAALGASAGLTATMLKLLGASAGGPTALASLSIPILVAGGMSTKAAQNAILHGSTNAKAMDALIQKYPELSRALRQAAVVSSQGE